MFLFLEQIRKGIVPGADTSVSALIWILTRSGARPVSLSLSFSVATFGLVMNWEGPELVGILTETETSSAGSEDDGEGAQAACLSTPCAPSFFTYQHMLVLGDFYGHRNQEASQGHHQPW